MNDHKKKLSEDIKKYLLENKLTQWKLADILGVTKCSVNNWINCRRFPQGRNWEKLRDLLET
jgi:predicted XRE-type DNA-binding protein